MENLNLKKQKTLVNFYAKLEERDHLKYSPDRDLARGRVLSVIDGVATIEGLFETKSGEMLEFINKQNEKLLVGMALNLNTNTIDAVLFGDERKVRPGDFVIGRGTVVSVPVGTGLLGRVVDALGVPIDGKGDLTNVV
jgi:F-type H+/Na+-transporting ATPase subunit alpha